MILVKYFKKKYMNFHFFIWSAEHRLLLVHTHPLNYIVVYMTLRNQNWNLYNTISPVRFYYVLKISRREERQWRNNIICTYIRNLVYIYTYVCICVGLCLCVFGVRILELMCVNVCDCSWIVCVCVSVYRYTSNPKPIFYKFSALN